MESGCGARYRLTVIARIDVRDHTLRVGDSRSGSFRCRSCQQRPAAHPGSGSCNDQCIAPAQAGRRLRGLGTVRPEPRRLARSDARAAFNERSWLYYTDWHWYLGWTQARFDLVTAEMTLSPLGNQLRSAVRAMTKSCARRAPSIRCASSSGSVTYRSPSGARRCSGSRERASPLRRASRAITGVSRKAPSVPPPGRQWRNRRPRSRYPSPGRPAGHAEVVIALEVRPVRVDLFRIHGLPG